MFLNKHLGNYSHLHMYFVTVIACTTKLQQQNWVNQALKVVD